MGKYCNDFLNIFHIVYIFYKFFNTFKLLHKKGTDIVFAGKMAKKSTKRY
jgi:hypothetical protein